MFFGIKLGKIIVYIMRSGWCEMKADYMLFMSGGLYFLIPLEQVVSVESLESASEMELLFYDFGQACHLREKPAETPYVLVLCINETKIGIAVERVDAVLKDYEAEVYRLQEPAACVDNQYLDSVVALEPPKPPFAYLLDVHALFDKLAGSSEAVLEYGKEVIQNDK